MNHRGYAAMLIGSSLTVAAACSGSTKPVASTAPTASTTTTLARLSDGQEPPLPSQVAPDSSRSGLVYWTRSGRHVAITRVRGGKPRTWKAGQGPGPVQSSIAPTIAARGDLIWVAADGNLIRVDTRANATTSVPLPAVRDNANLEAGLPAKERGVHFIRALAVDAHGHVAVALSASTQILVFDDAKKSFSKIDLPANDDAWSIAYYADGRLAVGASDAHGDVSTMFVVDTDGKIGKPFTVPDASRLVTLAPGSDLLAGTLGPAIVHADGRVQAVHLPAGVHANMSQGGVTPLPKGRFAVSTSSNVLVVDPDGSTSIVYRYPPGPCPLRGGPGLDPPSTTAPTNEECFVTPFAVEADRTGHLWIVRRRTGGTGPPIVVERL